MREKEREGEWTAREFFRCCLQPGHISQLARYYVDRIKGARRKVAVCLVFLTPGALFMCQSLIKFSL